MKTYQLHVTDITGRTVSSNSETVSDTHLSQVRAQLAEGVETLWMEVGETTVYYQNMDHILDVTLSVRDAHSWEYE